MDKEFFVNWLRNFVLLFVIVLAVGAFTFTFYPEALEPLSPVLTLMNMLLGLPLLIALLAVFTMPRKRSRRRRR